MSRSLEAKSYLNEREQDRVVNLLVGRFKNRLHVRGFTKFETDILSRPFSWVMKSLVLHAEQIAPSVEQDMQRAGITSICDAPTQKIIDRHLDASPYQFYPETLVLAGLRAIIGE